MLSYSIRPAWHGSVRKDGSTSIITGHLTDIRRRSYRPDVAFVEPLILKFDYAIETRRSNGNLASLGLIASLSLRTETFRLTYLQRFHVIERVVDSHTKQSPSLLRETFESRTGEPFRNMLDFRVVR
jgi:hypothetical protein